LREQQRGLKYFTDSEDIFFSRQNKEYVRIKMSIGQGRGSWLQNLLPSADVFNELASDILGLLKTVAPSIDNIMARMLQIAGNVHSSIDHMLSRIDNRSSSIDHSLLHGRCGQANEFPTGISDGFHASNKLVLDTAQVVIVCIGIGR
jgi:hypothetical protein